MSDSRLTGPETICWLVRFATSQADSPQERMMDAYTQVRHFQECREQNLGGMSMAAYAMFMDVDVDRFGFTAGDSPCAEMRREQAPQLLATLCDGIGRCARELWNTDRATALAFAALIPEVDGLEEWLAERRKERGGSGGF